ncbi:hypothetical protein [Streptantibioticus ferralitis]|uniref:Uncharacterized protein n=1 Tax=Streptantibioticus ferralitis TaxID=236510 RepID=A0ABT5Z7D2_9ACTN|nr:hypothetical protein [Streptantibioticus ferralitis]MDF2259739.1 hypothetical protein [Streptantibioticus ferralitis]
MQHSMTRSAPQPSAGIIDDIEREDDSKGYEPEDITGVDVSLVLLPATVPAFVGLEVAA